MVRKNNADDDVVGDTDDGNTDTHRYESCKSGNQDETHVMAH